MDDLAKRRVKELENLELVFLERQRKHTPIRDRHGGWIEFSLDLYDLILDDLRRSIQPICRECPFECYLTGKCERNNK